MNKLSYSLGASIAFNLKGQKISIESFEDFYNGLKDVLTDNNLKLTESEINEEIQNYFEFNKNQFIRIILTKENNFWKRILKDKML